MVRLNPGVDRGARTNLPEHVSSRQATSCFVDFKLGRAISGAQAKRTSSRSRPALAPSPASEDFALSRACARSLHVARSDSMSSCTVRLGRPPTWPTSRASTTISWLRICAASMISARIPLRDRPMTGAAGRGSGEEQAYALIDPLDLPLRGIRPQSRGSRPARGSVAAGSARHATSAAPRAEIAAAAAAVGHFSTPSTQLVWWHPLTTMARATSTSTTWSTRPPIPSRRQRRRPACSPQVPTSEGQETNIPSMSTVLSTPARTECSAQNSASTSRASH